MNSEIMKIRIGHLAFVLLIVGLFEVNCQPANPNKKAKTVTCIYPNPASLQTLFNQVILKAGTYSQLRNDVQVNEVNEQDIACGFNQFSTEQDHMPPKSAVKAAYQANPTNPALANALYGIGILNANAQQSTAENNMLAMPYKKGDHRLAGTTGSRTGVRFVTNLIRDTIKNNNVVLTYKYTVLATNTVDGRITSNSRDFTNYMTAYINRLNNYAGTFGNTG